MKKYLIILLSLFLVFSFVSCDGSTEEPAISDERPADAPETKGTLAEYASSISSDEQAAVSRLLSYMSNAVMHENSIQSQWKVDNYPASGKEQNFDVKVQFWGYMNITAVSAEGYPTSGTFNGVIKVGDYVFDIRGSLTEENLYASVNGGQEYAIDSSSMA